MKKLFYILLTILLTASCHYLEFDETSGSYSRETMYTTYSNIHKMLTNIYGYMPNRSIVDVSDAMRECGCDDAEFGDPDASVQRYGNGNWSAIQTVDTKWTFYNAIRSANEFLESLKTVDLSKYQYEAKYPNYIKHLELCPYEARLLKAYYLFELARRYGDIPVPEGMLTVEEANTIGKRPFDEVINLIVDECDTCAKYLPAVWTDALVDKDPYGHVTKGFAMALKTKALLYSASLLFNPAADQERWKKAAQAAKDVMDLNMYYLSPTDVANTVSNPETILQIMRSESSDYELYNFPIRFLNGKRKDMSGTYPTQNLVNAFQTIDGYDVTLREDGWYSEDPSFDPANPYSGRDPRFYRAILADGMQFKGSTIETFVGGADYSATRSGLCTPTGYYLRRYIVENTSFESESAVKNKHSWIVSRYAEILLSYAEAMNEYFGPDGKDGSLNVSAREALNQIRDNAGMPHVTVSGKDAFRAAVQREWRVEFAFEDHRFWDVRRWMIAPETQVEIYGVDIYKAGDGTKTYERKLVETRTWAERQYLYPIPQSELFCNPNLRPQNQGW